MGLIKRNGLETEMLMAYKGGFVYGRWKEKIQI